METSNTPGRDTELERLLETAAAVAGRALEALSPKARAGVTACLADGSGVLHLVIAMRFDSPDLRVLIVGEGNSRELAHLELHDRPSRLDG